MISLKPIPALGLYLYSQAAEDIGKNLGWRDSQKTSLLLKMAGAIRAGKLCVRDSSTGMPLTVISNIDSSSLVYVSKNDVNAWLTEAGVDYTWKPKPIPIKAAPGVPWEEKAQAIANKIGLERYDNGIHQVTAHNISEAVAIELNTDTTTHGIQGPRSANNVRTVGLKGWKFSMPKDSGG